MLKSILNKVTTTFNNTMEKVMRLNKPTAAAPVVPRVDAGVPDENVTVTFTLPRKKTLTDEQLHALEAEGKEVLAVCDLTGKPIFKAKNVNELHNGERPEFDGKTFATDAMKAILDAVEAANRR